MKKQIAACFLSMILFFSLAGNTLAAVSGQAGSSSIRVSLQELAPVVMTAVIVATVML